MRWLRNPERSRRLGVTVLPNTERANSEQLDCGPLATLQFSILNSPLLRPNLGDEHREEHDGDDADPRDDESNDGLTIRLSDLEVEHRASLYSRMTVMPASRSLSSWPTGVWRIV